jgi:hypothetical protein
MPDLVASLTSGNPRYALADLSAVPAPPWWSRTAPRRSSTWTGSGRPWSPTAWPKCVRARIPRSPRAGAGALASVPIVYADTRPLARASPWPATPRDLRHLARRPPGRTTSARTNTSCPPNRRSQRPSRRQTAWLRRMVAPLTLRPSHSAALNPIRDMIRPGAAARSAGRAGAASDELPGNV